MADATLCVGDFVCLYSAESYGFVFSTQSSSVNNEVAVGAKQDRLKPDMKDQNLVTFKIVVANRFKLNKNYRKLKERSDDDPENISLQSRLRQAQVAAKSETVDNELEQKRQLGKKVLYGQIIQLKHSFTLKYIHVSTTITSPTEISNMAVELHAYDAKHAQFKVMPRYKVKAEGDIVQVDDQIVFESIKSPGQYLHVSKTFLGEISVYHRSYELNLSVRQSGFTVYRKYKPSPDDEKKVKVGDMIRFYHKEMDAYMVAEGLFDDELVEDVHLRMRPLDQSKPKTMFPTSAAVTYWQIELEEGIVAGGVLEWEQKCRLLHMCSRRYLTLDANGKLTLTANSLEPGTVFRLHPVIYESDDIPEDSYCRIEHVVSGHWLHAFTEEFKKQQTAAAEAHSSESMQSLKWSTAKLKKLGAIAEKQYDDAFTIQSVDQSFQELFNFMAGMVPFIQKLVSDKKSGVLINAKMAHKVTTSLKEITDFMIVDGEPIKKRQKLMRNLRIVELLVSLLKSPFQGGDKYHMTRIFVDTYDVLYTYLMGNSRKNELYIAKYIDFFLAQFEIKEDCVFFTELGENIGLNDGIMYVSTNNGTSWTELDTFASRDLDNDEYLYLEHQLDLFGYLCNGQNYYSISVITQELNYLTWKEAFTCLSDEGLPDQLRAMYCDLIITMFVDISDNHSVVDRIKLSYIYNDVDNEHNVTDNSDSLTYKYFGELSQWISGFLSRNGDMIASLIGKNMLVKQVLRLVDYLVLFGFYGRFEDIETLLKPLMSLLDGRNDMPYPECRGKAAKHMLHVFRTSERFKQSPETKAIVEAKIQALEMLDLFLNFVMSIRLEKFISLFKTTNSQGGKTELSLLMYDDFDLQKIHVQGLDENLALEDDSAAKAGMKKLHKIFDDTSFLRKYNVVEILLDLSHYEYDDMVRKSMHLLNRFYSAHNNLFKRAVQAQVLITDTSMGVYNKTQELLRSMKRLAANKLTDETAHKLAEILDELIWFCHLDDEEEEPHFMNQNILYNNGIIEDIFTVISKQIDVKLLDQYTGLRQVFQKAFILLKMLARDNKIVQQRLFDRLDMLLSTQGAACELAEALTEVFTGNDKTCMKIAQHHVQKIMALVAQHTTKVPQFLDLLNAVVKVEELDLPLKRNQGFVMTYFMQFRSEIAFLIDQDEAAREAVLTTTNSHEQNYLIATVDLLATCAEGENRFIESICQTIFKIPKLLKVLNNPNISDNLKRPFLRFFLWVYLNTASGMIESGAGDIPHDPAMWGYLTSLSGTLAMVTDFSRNNSDDVKQLLKKAPGKTYREITDLQITRPADLVDPCVDKRDAVRGSLHYLFDAVMPFLQVFCRSYYKVDTALYPNEPEDMDSLTRNFKGCLEVIAPLVSKERQMTNLISCMGVLFASSSLSRESEEFHAKYGDGLRPQDVRSDARQEYEKYFEKEEHLNHQLNVFAVNMKSAYGGVNDVQTQIGYPSKKPYSEIDGDEELPLGPDFQAHINSFINPAGHTGLDKYKMAQKLIKALAISATLTNLNEKEKIEQVNLDIRCMQLLRGMLHNEIVKLPADFENDVTGCRKQLKLIEECQNALNHHNAIPATLEHLSRPQDSIVQELLAFLSCILFNGNGNVQSSMYAYFTDTFKEVFFFSIKNRITLSSIATRERRHLHAMHQAKMDEKKFNRPMTAMAGIDTAQKGDTRAASTPIDRPTSNTLHVKGALPLLNGLEMRGLVKGSQMSFGSRFSVPGTNRVGPIPDTERAPSGPVSTIPAFQFKDDGYIELVLRVLGLMCDNQHEDLQNYLREQPDNIKSVNLIAETTKFLNIIYSNISSDSIALITQVFDILVEFTSGNAINQSVVFDNKICDYINHILRVGVYKDCKDEEIYQLKCSIAILIRCLTEEMPDIDDADTNQQSNVPTEVMVYLDTEVLVNIMTEAFEAAQATVDVDRWNVLTNVGFQYYHLLRRKFDLDPNIVTLDSIKTPESQVPLEFYEGGTLSVEIVKDDVLQKLYFRVKDKNALRDEIKQKLNYEVDRSSPSNKIRDFMDWSSDIIKEIKYQRRGKSNPIGRVLVDAWLPLNYLVMLLTLAITILLMASWEAGPDTQPLYQPSYRWTKAKAGIYVLSGIHNFLSLAIFLSYAISNRPTFPAFGNIINMFRKQSGDEDTGEKAWNDKHGESHLEVKAFGFKSIYYVIFLACSAAGTATDGYFFAFHLLHIAEMNQLLKRVIQAVTTNGKSLMLVGLLGLAVLYIYALILFAFYRGTFWQAADGHQCTTIYECFVSIIHHGLSDTTYNQFAGSMTDHFPEAIGITFFDVSFFIIITTIGLNIVFGIIVDTFSQLRDAKWKIDRDMQNNCFICGRESYDFERHGKGFQKHVKDEHNQWAYLFFFIHLDETRPNDYSALELYVYKRLLQSNFDFFPLNRAMCLENEDDNVEKKVDYLVAKMKEQDADREREKEKQRQIAWEAKHRGRQST